MILPPLLDGLKVTLKLTGISALVAFIMAFIIAFMHMSPYRPLRWIAKIYLEFFRGTSLLVQLFWAYFVLPFFGVELTAMQAGIIVLGLCYGAYASEVVRSSIEAIPEGQTEAGIALNMSSRQIMYHIILPQAFVRMIPPLGNILIQLLKGTALVSLITLSDLMNKATQVRSTTLLTTETFSLVLLLYFIIAYPLTLAIRWYEKRLTRGRS